MERVRLLVLFAVLVPAACGPPQQVDPATQVPQTPPAQCFDPARAVGSPLTVNLSGPQQALLQTKLSQDGIVLVHFDCNTLSVLDRCSANGAYGYMGIEPQLDQAQLLSDQEVAVSLSGGLSFLATVGGGFSQHRSLDLAVMTVGIAGTPLNVLSRGQIRGPDCAQATHYVRRAYRGGFAMSEGQGLGANTAATLFQVGAQVGYGQTQSIQHVAGSLAACQLPASADDAPPAGCDAVVRLGLVPLEQQQVTAERARASLSANPHLRQCAPGHVFSGGVCRTWSEQLPSWLCRGKDVRECEDQCNRGDLPSCGRYAFMLAEANATATPEERAGLLSQLTAVVPKIDQACEAYEGDACGFLATSGLATLEVQGVDPSAEEPDPASTMMAARSAMQAERGCLAGHAESCEILTQILGPQATLEAYGISTDVQRLALIVERACNGGNPGACAAMSMMALEPSFAGQVQVADPFSFAERACLAGSDIGCYVAGVFHIGGGKACNSFLGKGASRICEVQDHKNLDRAASAFKRACDLSEEGLYCAGTERMSLIRECDEGAKKACKKLKKKASK
jgi:hypothetical protein